MCFKFYQALIRWKFRVFVVSDSQNFFCINCSKKSSKPRVLEIVRRRPYSHIFLCQCLRTCSTYRTTTTKTFQILNAGNFHINKWIHKGQGCDIVYFDPIACCRLWLAPKQDPSAPVQEVSYVTTLPEVWDGESLDADSNAAVFRPSLFHLNTAMPSYSGTKDMMDSLNKFLKKRPIPGMYVVIVYIRF